VIALLITVVSTPIIVRLLGTDRYGDYAFLLAVYGILSMATNFGMSQSLRKYFPEKMGSQIGTKE
jgi:O-antigen/teichoic acid export membrane protein